MLEPGHLEKMGILGQEQMLAREQKHSDYHSFYSGISVEFSLLYKIISHLLSVDPERVVVRCPNVSSETNATEVINLFNDRRARKEKGITGRFDHNQYVRDILVSANYTFSDHKGGESCLDACIDWFFPRV